MLKGAQSEKENAMRFRTSFIFCLLLALAMPLGAAGQEASSAAPQALRADSLFSGPESNCPEQSTFRQRRPQGRTGSKLPCKPMMVRAEGSQSSKDVSRHDDGGTWITFDPPNSLSTNVTAM